MALRQAKAVTGIGSDKWTSVDEGSLDTSRPYLCELPSGKTISLFFYHGDLAMEVAFRGALDNGELLSANASMMSLKILMKIPCFTTQQTVSPTVIITGTVKW